MRMLRDFKALSFQSCTNVSFLHNVSTTTKARNYRILYVMCIYFYLHSSEQIVSLTEQQDFTVKLSAV